MPQPIAYLSFPGTCAEAMRFYERALHGKIETLLTHGEAPIAAQCGMGDADRIMHACLALPDGGMLMAGDCPQHLPYHGIHGVSITLSYDTVSDAERAFAALAEGGKIEMPMQATFWAKVFGMLTDRFGTPWIVNGVLQPIGHA